MRVKKKKWGEFDIRRTHAALCKLRAPLISGLFCDDGRAIIQAANCLHYHSFALKTKEMQEEETAARTYVYMYIYTVDSREQLVFYLPCAAAGENIIAMMSVMLHSRSVCVCVFIFLFLYSFCVYICILIYIPLSTCARSHVEVTHALVYIYMVLFRVCV